MSRSRLRRPATAGVVASLAVVVAVLLPFAVVGQGGVETYYDYGLGGPWSAFALTLIAAVVFAAGRQGRTAPDLAAGAALGVGVVATVFAAVWALAVPTDVVLQLTTGTWFQYHRGAVVAASAAIAVCGAWYAYELDLF